MSAEDDSKFVPENEANEATIDDTDAAKEDDAVAKSEESGTISQDEVKGLKDDLGGGEVLDSGDRPGKGDVNYKDAEDKLDAAVEETS